MLSYIPSLVEVQLPPVVCPASHIDNTPARPHRGDEQAGEEERPVVVCGQMAIHPVRAISHVHDTLCVCEG